MNIVRGLAVLLLFELLGELVVRAAGVPVPGNVAGMVLLLVALGLHVVPLTWVKPAADALLEHLSLLFVPAGVGVMLYADLVAREWLPILFALVPSTLAVMAATGWTAGRLSRGRGGGGIPAGGDG